MAGRRMPLIGFLRVVTPSLNYPLATKSLKKKKKESSALPSSPEIRREGRALKAGNFRWRNLTTYSRG